ncbi:hypothetical protein BDF14DRAFT_382367 [Spinellus fusiger]|nr:hypothetical protein BDF14DRAFT_382367 [Spinellus fusiger]
MHVCLIIYMYIHDCVSMSVFLLFVCLFFCTGMSSAPTFTGPWPPNHPPNFPPSVPFVPSAAPTAPPPTATVAASTIAPAPAVPALVTLPLPVPATPSTQPVIYQPEAPITVASYGNLPPDAIPAIVDNGKKKASKSVLIYNHPTLSPDELRAQLEKYTIKV